MMTYIVWHFAVHLYCSLGDCFYIVLFYEGKGWVHFVTSNRLYVTEAHPPQVPVGAGVQSIEVGPPFPTLRKLILLVIYQHTGTQRHTILHGVSAATVRSRAEGQGAVHTLFFLLHIITHADKCVFSSASS